MNNWRKFFKSILKHTLNSDHTRKISNTLQQDI